VTGGAEKSEAGCTRRSPGSTPKDAGSIPATSTRAPAGAPSGTSGGTDVLYGTMPRSRRVGRHTDAKAIPAAEIRRGVMLAGSPAVGGPREQTRREELHAEG
jgi:hypothetical protein